ncbi:hypothetical protein JMUB3936_1405 [Leptotrichia wadei]|uniref:Uncharacterized protein n=1 Tax=Leptotrichia wadei TaxID=157687 RepID=A0A510KWG3_9FUSO|nr:hypothetical protein [Leptotrichia wadei]BBM55121.1 hypothetical protein JMUB3936_1405 [Leptotrichia wadei]
MAENTGNDNYYILWDRYAKVTFKVKMEMKQRKLNLKDFKLKMELIIRQISRYKLNLI